MAFKGRFFYSKKSDSSSPDGSNSPKTQNSGSPIKSEKKKVKSAKDEQQIGGSFDAAYRETLEMGKSNSSWINSGGLRSSNICTPETPYDCGTPKDSESPSDIKSFSHELNSKGVRPFPFWKPRGLNNLEEVLAAIRAKFYKAKEEVDSDLAVFGGDLVGILEKNTETHPEWQETIEDLLVLARSCAIMTPREFWLKCEGIVQDLDDQRQEIPMGMLKQLHTRMLFILTRCTRLLHFRNECGFPEDEHVLGLHQYRVLHSSTA